MTVDRDVIPSASSGASGKELQTATEHFRSDFRGDIEGLRALAILMVVASHAGLSVFSGGYVGVDVFFVLSGYLITGLLLQEIRSTGGLRLVAFYSRRLRRLLPALLFMVIGTTVLASVVLAPAEQVHQAATAGITSVWASNFLFGFSGLDYFSPAAETNLFLHTWSLAVEEQFYLVWPVFVMCLLGAWHWQGKRFNGRRLIVGMSATVVLCLVLTLFLSYSKPLWAFYLMPARAWQFALGALCLLWSSGDDHRTVSTTGRQITHGVARVLPFAGWTGLTLIVVAGVVLDSNTVYPGAWAIVPSLGTALVLVAGSSKTATGVTRLLSIGPLLFVGRISYSWYLWHWPLLILGGAVIGRHDSGGQVVLVGVSLLMAIASHFLVESPVRRNPTMIRRPVFSLGLSALLTLGAVGIAGAWQGAAVSWSKLPEQRVFQEVRLELPAIYPMGCDEWFYSAQVNVCLFGEKDAKKTAVLMGDSVAGQWFPAIAAAYVKPGWRLLVLTKSACPMVDEPIFYKRIGMQYTVCSQWRDAVLNALVELDPDVVFMGGASTYDYSEAQWVSGTKRVLDRVAPLARRVFIIHGTHQLPFDGPDCLARRAWQPHFLTGLSDCSAAVPDQGTNGVLPWLRRASALYKNVAVLDLNPLVCPDGRCYAERDHQIVFRDSQHLSVRYVDRIAEKVAHGIATVAFD